ncbi:MAG: hypothetical protein HY692_03485 [Cyanobacteria bacterium NC_groundwater_1444_Ag_S-0.65um_54_12]|nr:hypothetical protein [Cyanobacteria bacterium NC_groundwater_1444_Ag_S-0.65um_54_12]
MESKIGMPPSVSAKPRQLSETAKKTAKAALQFGPDVAVGAGEAMLDMAKGIGTLVRHPRRTGNGILYLATQLVKEPRRTLGMLGYTLIDPYVVAIQAGHPGKAVGRGIVEIGTLFITPADVVSVVRCGKAAGQATMASWRSGNGLRAAVQHGSLAARYSAIATKAARQAETLVRLGHAKEARLMAYHAQDAIIVSKIASSGRFKLITRFLARVDLARKVNLGQQALTLGQFLKQADQLLGVRRWQLFSGQAWSNIPLLTARDGSAYAVVTRLAERILANGAKKPDLLQRLGRLATRDPHLLAPLTPWLGKIPDVLSRMNALPRNLPSDAGLTPERASEIAKRFHLEPELANVQAFIIEVSHYQDNAIGPDTGSPPAVQQLQLLLKLNGHASNVTGVWDRATARAVIEFKKAHDLRQTYRLKNGELAVNNYVDEKVMAALLAGVDRRQLPADFPRKPLP